MEIFGNQIKSYKFYNILKWNIENGCSHIVKFECRKKKYWFLTTELPAYLHEQRWFTTVCELYVC